MYEGTVEKGMIFPTVSGICLPGEFGVRIGELMLVTKTGLQRLVFFFCVFHFFRR